MKYIPVVRCEFCPYKRPHNIIVGEYKCVAMPKDYDNIITHCIVSETTLEFCPLPEFDENGLPEGIEEDNNEQD